MINFEYVRVRDVADAVRLIADDRAAKFVAGGTNLIHLMKMDVERPTKIIDINRLPLNQIESTPSCGLGDRLVNDLVAHVIERRRQRVREAPQAIGEFLAFHFRGAEADLAWLHYLMREALVFGNRPVPQERERQEAVSLQVQEIRDRQAAGLLPAELDPGHLRLFGFALMNYPRMLPQITRMTTGMAADSPGFVANWEALLREVGSWIEEAARRKKITRPNSSRSTRKSFFCLSPDSRLILFREYREWGLPDAR